jgi:hypothetical protein
MPAYDAILIPGGGVRPGGLLPPWVQRRLERALELWRGEYLVTLSAGTPHRPPPLDEQGFPIFESVAGARWLAAHGVDPARLRAETCSYDTLGNAYFARRLHVDPLGLRRLLVITSAFHLPRAQAVFTWIFGLEPPPGGYALSFAATPDDGLEPELLAARQAKEQAALAALPALQARLTSLPALHEWLFQAHAAYAVGAPRPEANKPARDSY